MVFTIPETQTQKSVRTDPKKPPSFSPNNIRTTSIRNKYSHASSHPNGSLHFAKRKTRVRPRLPLKKMSSRTYSHAETSNRIQPAFNISAVNKLEYTFIVCVALTLTYRSQIIISSEIVLQLHPIRFGLKTVMCAARLLTLCTHEYIQCFVRQTVFAVLPEYDKGNGLFASGKSPFPVKQM